LVRFLLVEDAVGLLAGLGIEQKGMDQRHGEQLSSASEIGSGSLLPQKDGMRATCPAQLPPGSSGWSERGFESSGDRLETSENRPRMCEFDFPVATEILD